MLAPAIISVRNYGAIAPGNRPFLNAALCSSPMYPPAALSIEHRMHRCGNCCTETLHCTDQERPGRSKGGAPRSKSIMAMIAGGNHTTIPRRGLLRCPISSSALKSLRQLSTAATRSARFICHRQRSHRSPLPRFFRVFLAGTRKTPAGGKYIIFRPIKKGAVFTAPFKWS